jgi:hypothetical protein
VSGIVSITTAASGVVTVAPYPKATSGRVVRAARLRKLAAP